MQRYQPLSEQQVIKGQGRQRMLSISEGQRVALCLQYGNGTHSLQSRSRALSCQVLGRASVMNRPRFQFPPRWEDSAALCDLQLPPRSVCHTSYISAPIALAAELFLSSPRFMNQCSVSQKVWFSTFPHQMWSQEVQFFICYSFRDCLCRA